MTEKIPTDKARTKLTLKLSLKPSDSSVRTSNQSRVTDGKKISNSTVQVTIKGRKKTDFNSNETKKNLNKTELEARAKAIDRQSKSEDQEIKTYEILSKFKKEQKNQLEENEKRSNKNTFKSDPEESKPDEENSEKNSPNISDSSKSTETKGEKHLEQKSAKNTNPLEDEFDVRSKIKKSIELDNQQKLVREKIAEERRQKELEIQKAKQVQEIQKKQPIASKDDRKKLKKNEPESLENISGDKKPSPKDAKFSSKKYTYFISSNSLEDDFDDSEAGRARRRRRKSRQKQEEQKEYKKIIREVILPDLITVSELAERMSEKAGDVVKKLFSMGMVVTSNQAIDTETAEIIINEFGHIAKRVSHSDVENILKEDSSGLETTSRAPVVTIMGHVDHGKTSLLDALRKTDIVSSEHGGITQHIGASRIKTKDGKFITFLDTPGHEAFTEMRSRGANITDIVILVVAADDGVKEQTIEAIHHAKAANVPIIVAVNKIDKPGANPEIVKNELLSYELVSEDMGGDIMFVSVSAKTKTNLDKLEEAILLQAEMLDLKAPQEGKSSGVVLEARIDPSRGTVATVLVQSGTLDISDLIVAGTACGKIRRMSDHNGKNISHATASMPVEIFGLDSIPNAGDKFVEVEEEHQAREIIAYRQRVEKEKKILRNSARSINDIFRQSGESKMKYLNIILKSDVHGSLEAISGSIAKIVSDEVAVKIIHSATGAISDSDVNLAAVSGGIIIGFNVRSGAETKNLAAKKGVLVHYYSVIYNLIDDLKAMLSGLLNPSRNEEFLGTAEVRQVFKVSGIGKVAGCMVIEGQIKRNARARLLRDNVVIFDGELKTLKRFKEDAKEVKLGFECGIAFENYEDLKEKDSIECYEIVEQKRVIS